MERPAKSGATAAQALAPVLRREAARLRSAEAGIRLDRVDSVHEFRLAGRRLRSLLRSAPAMFESATAPELTAGLRMAGQVASPTRDADVLRSRVMLVLADEPEGAGLLRLRERLDRALEGQRRRHWLDLVDYLDGRDFDTLARRLDGFSDLIPWSPLSRQPAREVLKPVLERQGRSIESMMRRLTTAEPNDQLDEELHRLRKRAKTVRYLSDALVPTLGDPAKKVRKAMRRMQTILGDLNDGVLLVAFLDQARRDQAMDPQEALVLRRVHLRAASNAAYLRSEFLETHRSHHRRTSAS